MGAEARGPPLVPGNKCQRLFCSECFMQSRAERSVGAFLRRRRPPTPERAGRNLCEEEPPRTAASFLPLHHSHAPAPRKNCYSLGFTFFIWLLYCSP